MTPPLLRALEQEQGRHRYLAGPPHGGPRAKPWRGRRLDYITYRGVPGGPLSPVGAQARDARGRLALGRPLNLTPAPQEAEQVTFSTALAGLTDHLAVGLRLRVSMHAGGTQDTAARPRGKAGTEAKREPGGPQPREQATE